MYLDQHRTFFTETKYKFELFLIPCSIESLKHYQPLGFYAKN